MTSIVEQDPDIKSAERAVPRTLHIYHRCQDEVVVKVALCGARTRSRQGPKFARANLPSETCVVCVDLLPTCLRCDR